MDLQPPDLHHFNAALGWIELGNHVEAGEELARVSPANLNHPDILEVRWAICAAGRSWNAAVTVAEALVVLAPDRVSGWVHRAYAVRRQTGGGLEQAEQLLRPALDKFPKESIVPYNLACYAVQLGRPDEAIELLRSAIRAEGNRQVILDRARADRDLEPLWPQLHTL